MLETISKSVIKGIIYGIIGVICALIILPKLTPAQPGAFPPIAQDKWQAVFLDNGQVYFGKLKDDGGSYVTLSSVYYLKEASDLQQSNLNLVKLGGELHGPEDEMHINKGKISFWENMKDASRVVQSIQNAVR